MLLFQWKQHSKRELNMQRKEIGRLNNEIKIPIQRKEEKSDNIEGNREKKAENV